jgi:hypothetical protein
VCHTGIISPTYASHVGYWSTTSKHHVEELQPAAASHAGGTCLVTASNTAHPSPTSYSHVEFFLLASASHAGSMSPATASYAGGIHMIEKPRRLRHKPIFFCRTYEGRHLTRLCPVTTRIPEAWGSPKGPSGSEPSMVSQHSVPSLVDTTIMPMKSSTETSFPLGVDASFDLVFSHLVQLVVMSMKYSTDTSPMFKADASLDLVVLHLVQPMVVIQVDIGGHPPFPTGSKQLYGNFGNLLFLAGFNFRGHFEGPNEGFSRSRFSMIAKGMIEPPK